jgi:hypothetical protein
VDDLRQPLRVLDLRGPLGKTTEDLAVIQLLERLTADLVGIHLTDEQDHRRGVLLRGVHGDARVGRTRPPRDEADPGLSGQLAIGLRHVRCAAFLTADVQAQRVLDVVHRVDRGEIALPGDGEDRVDAVQQQLVDQYLTSRPRARAGRDATWGASGGGNGAGCGHR